MNSSVDVDDDEVVDSYELDHIVRDFQVSRIDEIGSNLNWFKKTDKMSKLYRVAVAESIVESTSNERVKTALTTFSKLDDIVRELVAISIWKETILPQLLKLSPEPKQSFPTYVVLFYEIVIHGIVQSAIYHGDVFNYMSDTCDDLTEYCVRKLTRLHDNCVTLSVDDIDDPLEEIKKRSDVVDFNVGSQCVATLRYVVDNLDSVPLSVGTRIYSTHDVPVLIAQLLHRNVWTRKSVDKTFKYDGTDWHEIRRDSPPLTKMECQVWLLLRQLLLNSTATTGYRYSDYRKEQLSVLLKYLNDAALDQMSVLLDLQKVLYLLQARPKSEGDPSVNNPLIIEITPLYRDRLTADCRRRKERIATKTARLLFRPDDEETRLLATWFSKSVEFLIDVKEKLNSCGYCMKNALNRCGRCKRVWYCSKSCQTQHWVVHKPVCSSQ